MKNSIFRIDKRLAEFLGAVGLVGLLACGGTDGSTSEVQSRCEVQQAALRATAMIGNATIRESTRLAPWTLDNKGHLASEVRSGLLEELGELESATLESFVRANQASHKVELRCFPLEEQRRLTSRGRQDVTIEVSAPGFSPDRDQAFVYVGVFRGDASEGWYLLFTRDDDAWVEVGRVRAWIA